MENGEWRVDWKSEYRYEEYDNKGNWTKRIYYDDDTPSSITEREIEYYE